MNKTFNELFDEFFKRNNIKPEDKIDKPTKSEVEKIIDMLEWEVEDEVELEQQEFNGYVQDETPLSEQLEIAIEKEDYEKAVVIRDLIKKEEKKEK